MVLWTENRSDALTGLQLHGAYRVGSRYTLEAVENATEFITVALADGVRVSRSGAGELMLYRGAERYGRRLHAALEAGWCEILR